MRSQKNIDSEILFEGGDDDEIEKKLKLSNNGS